MSFKSQGCKKKFVYVRVNKCITETDKGKVLSSHLVTDVSTLPDVSDATDEKPGNVSNEWGRSDTQEMSTNF